MNERKGVHKIMAYNTLTEREAFYCLCHVPGFGSATIGKLRERFGTYQEVWTAKEQEIQKAGVLTEKRVTVFLQAREQESAWLKEFYGLERTGIRFIAEGDIDYPERFLPYKDRPAALFVKGNLPENEVPAVAIVGARACTEYGKEAAGFYAGELANAGVNIISGMAAGVDGCAHRGAIERGKPTYAVLGCGVNICYPRENYKIFHAMEENGGILSEFVPGTRPVAMNFPLRNRIISALADAVIIIEAREKSGSLITADFALEQGKEVFALPGRANDPLSGGCNRLIQGGASLLLSPSDVLEFLGMKYERKLTIHKFSQNRLAKNENLVYASVDSRPRHLEEVAALSGLSVTECMEALLKLELAGLVFGTGNQYYKAE